MRRTSVTMAVVTVVAAAGLSACGGSDESDPAAAAVMSQVEEICDQLSLSLADRGEFPVADFDPENPDAGDLPAVGDYFAAGLDEQPRAIAELKTISAAGEQRAQIDALVEAWTAENDIARAQVDAALAGDVDAFVATLGDASASFEATSEATSALGVPDCGRG